MYDKHFFDGDEKSFFEIAPKIFLMFFFRYINRVWQNWNISGCFQCIYIASRPNILLLRLSNQGLCHLCLVTQTKNFEKLKCKKSIFSVYGKMLVIQFPYMKKY